MLGSSLAQHSEGSIPALNMHLNFKLFTAVIRRAFWRLKVRQRALGPNGLIPILVVYMIFAYSVHRPVNGEVALPSRYQEKLRDLGCC